MIGDKPTLRALLLLFLGAVGLYLFATALNMPVQWLQSNVLRSIQAYMALLVLAAAYVLFLHPFLYVNLTDVFAILLLIGITGNWLFVHGLAANTKYDDSLQVAILYIVLRVIFMSEYRAKILLQLILYSLCVYEASIGIAQVYGFTNSNHDLFTITGTLFNPGPYAGFIAPIFICAVAYIIRSYKLSKLIINSWASLCRKRIDVLIWGWAPYILSWVVVAMTILVLPATMSRAALIAVVACFIILVVREFDVIKLFNRVYRANPFRVSSLSVILVLFLVGFLIGAYYIKHASADGRLLIWKIDTRIMLNNPICGVGLGNFASAFGEEQANYFSSKKRTDTEIQIAGCPESGFNEFLQFGSETGLFGFVLLLLCIWTSIFSQIRRGHHFGYSLLAASLFACFSYPWSVLPLRHLFVLLLASTSSRPIIQIKGYWQSIITLLFVLCIVCLPNIYGHYENKVNARQQWNDVRIWINSEHYGYLIEDGKHICKILHDDFRFLYDYGYALHKAGDYQLSNEQLKKGMQISNDPMFWNIAGKNYEMLGNYYDAECAYLRAHNMLPDRIYPLYLSAKLYKITGQHKKAYDAALKVVSHKPKIESEQTRDMQTEMRRTFNLFNVN